MSALWGDLTFQVRGNGAVESIALRDVRDSTFFTQLAAALRAGTGVGVLTPFGAGSEIRYMVLKPAMSASKSGATWAMFTMEVPREQFVTVVKRPSISYPYATRFRNADFKLLFYVDTAGKPEPRTIVTVPAFDAVAWPDVETGKAYRAFVATARRGVQGSRFKPAEFLGCRRRQFVAQPMHFEMRPQH